MNRLVLPFSGESGSVVLDREDRLRVVDLARLDHADEAVEGECAALLDLPDIRLARLGEPAGEKQCDPLVGEAGRCEEAD